ncbi:MAG: PLP-dependent cysteine synthase family protein [Fimbriimonas sp.]
MASAVSSIIDTIGSTPVVQLRQLVSPGMASVFVKLEGTNPTGSKKDRMAREVIESAARRGELKDSQPVVEYTGGSTGTSLALVCAATGHKLFIVSSDAFSQEKRDHMTALGAEVLLVQSDRQQITQALIKAMIQKASEIASQENAFWTDQLNNRDAARGYEALGHELIAQIGVIDAYVDSIGTAHGIIGVSAGLRSGGSLAKVVGVEPAESPVITQGKTGAHRIEGMGLGFVAPHWNESVTDSMETVSSEEAHAMARRLASEEGIFAGASTGANVVAALRIAARLGPHKTVATIAVDNGMKYLSTEVYRRS